MKTRTLIGCTLMAAFLTLTACNKFRGDSDDMEDPTYSFDITVTNAVNFFNATAFNTPDGAEMPGPLPEPGTSYSVTFKAYPGSLLSFATMSVISNDWFYAPSGEGIALFEEGSPISGDITEQIYLWDAGVEEEDPATRTSEPGGAEAGAPDDDTSVRIVDATVEDQIRVWLECDNDEGYFTLTIENVAGAMHPETPTMLSPGITVVHAMPDALFTEGDPDRGLGLSDIAVQGNPGPLHGWFTETGSNGLPLRLASSFTVLSPGTAYAFEAATDPLFELGMPHHAESGLEALAEDGMNGGATGYLGMEEGLPATNDDQAAIIPPGQSLTFTLEDVPAGYKLGLATMFVFSNDWFLAARPGGIPLFDASGSPVENMDATAYIALYDAGTEADEPVGFGDNQAPFQFGPDTGDPDPDNTVRYVMSIDDLQFGKGLLENPSAAAGFENPEGGYNLVTVTIRRH